MSGETRGLRVVRRSPTLQALTTQKLREAILSMHFAPGQRLIERELCEQTGVSRTSVREALRHLESEGLVERRPNHGIFVASVSAEEAWQIYELRAALESAMARLFVARASGEQMKSLQSALAAIERAVAEGRDGDYVAGLERFYTALLKGSGNLVALKVVQSLRARIAYLRSLTTQREAGSRRFETVALMRGIVEAAAARDADLIERRCREFVERSAAYALLVLEDTPAVPEASLVEDGDLSAAGRS